ncbi:MAG: Rpn family recombination-promoting nuclease/putative transposase [Alcaligenes sp.]
MSRYDTFYRSLFDEPLVLHDFIAHCLPDELGERIEQDSLQSLSTCFSQADRPARQADMAWSLSLKGGQRLLLLLEHQSRSDRSMALRMRSYGTLLHERHHHNEPTAQLPPILPVVLHTGDTPWSAATDVQTLQPNIPPWLQRYNPAQAFLLIEQKQLLLNQSLPPQAIITPIFRLQHLQSMDELRECLHTIARLTHPIEHARLRRLLSSWVQHVVLPLHLPHLDTPLIHSFEDIDAMINYEERNWEVRWMKQGEVQGERLLLERQLQKRFGALDDATGQRLKQASREELESWSLNLLDARALEDVFRT